MTYFIEDSLRSDRDGQPVTFGDEIQVTDNGGETGTLNAALITLQNSIAAITAASGGNGWSPVWALVRVDNGAVLQARDWTGGTGSKPPTGFVGATGLVSTAAQATVIRDGAAGARGVQGERGLTGQNGQPGAAGLTPTVTFSQPDSNTLRTRTVYSRPASTPPTSETDLTLPRGAQGERGVTGLRGAQGERGLTGPAGWGIGSITASQSGNDVTVRLVRSQTSSAGTSEFTFTVPTGSGSTGGQTANQVRQAIQDALDGLIDDRTEPLTVGGSTALTATGGSANSSVTLLNYTLTDEQRARLTAGENLVLRMTVENTFGQSGFAAQLSLRARSTAGIVTVDLTTISLTRNAVEDVVIPLSRSDSESIQIVGQSFNRGGTVTGEFQIYEATIDTTGSHNAEFTAFVESIHNRLAAAGLIPIDARLTQLESAVAGIGDIGGLRTEAEANGRLAAANANGVKANAAAIASITGDPAISLLRSAAVYDELTAQNRAEGGVLRLAGAIAPAEDGDLDALVGTGAVALSHTGLIIIPQGSAPIAAETWAFSGTPNLATGAGVNDRVFFGASFTGEGNISLVGAGEQTILELRNGAVAWQVPVAATTSTRTATTTIPREGDGHFIAEVDTGSAGEDETFDGGGTYTVPSGGSSVRIKFNARVNGRIWGAEQSVAVPSTSTGDITLTFTTDSLPVTFQYRITRLSSSRFTLRIVAPSGSRSRRQLTAEVTYNHNITTSTPASYTDIAVQSGGEAVATAGRVVKLSLEIQAGTSASPRLIIETPEGVFPIDPPATTIPVPDRATLSLGSAARWTQVVLVAPTTRTLAEFAAAPRIIPGGRYTALAGFAGIASRTVIDHEGLKVQLPDNTVVQMVPAPESDGQFLGAVGGSWEPVAAPSGGGFTPVTVAQNESRYLSTQPAAAVNIPDGATKLTFYGTLERAAQQDLGLVSAAIHISRLPVNTGASIYFFDSQNPTAIAVANLALWGYTTNNATVLRYRWQFNIGTNGTPSRQRIDAIVFE